MNKIQVILTIDMNKIPGDFQSILIQEKIIVDKWKEEGILEHLFLRKSKNGAILIFKNIDEDAVKDLMRELPLFKLNESIEYFELIQQF
jgi:muconolactone D-isomerase